jgi:hypothetical protein
MCSLPLMWVTSWHLHKLLAYVAPCNNIPPTHEWAY